MHFPNWDLSLKKSTVLSKTGNFPVFSCRLLIYAILVMHQDAGGQGMRRTVTREIWAHLYSPYPRPSSRKKIQGTPHRTEPLISHSRTSTHAHSHLFLYPNSFLFSLLSHLCSSQAIHVNIKRSWRKLNKKLVLSALTAHSHTSFPIMYDYLL